MRISDWSSDVCSSDLLTRSMQRIDTLMNQAEGIAFDLASTEAALREQFPDVFDTAMTSDQMLPAAQAQWPTAKHEDRKSFVQRKIVSVSVTLGGRGDNKQNKTI